MTSKDPNVVMHVLAIPDIEKCIPAQKLFDVLVKTAQEFEQIAPHICSFLVGRFLAQYPGFQDRVLNIVTKHLYTIKKVL
jgi:hypothetical protein